MDSDRGSLLAPLTRTDMLRQWGLVNRQAFDAELAIYVQNLRHVKKLGPAPSQQSMRDAMRLRQREQAMRNVVLA